MLQAELDKIIAEITDDECSLAEQNRIIMLIVEITMNTIGFPNKIRRKTFEILYRYYAMVEGLEKK